MFGGGGRDVLDQLLRNADRAIAVDHGKEGIRCNAVAPGWIDTDLTKRAREQVDGLHQSVEKRTPVHRWGTPDDLVGLCLFLLSDETSWMTGHVVNVDGGQIFRA